MNKTQVCKKMQEKVFFLFSTTFKVIVHRIKLHQGQQALKEASTTTIINNLKNIIKKNYVKTHRRARKRHVTCHIWDRMVNHPTQAETLGRPILNLPTWGIKG